MLRRLFQLLLLAALVGGGYLYWKHRGLAHAPGDIDSLSRQVHDAKVTTSVEAAFKLNGELSRAEIDVSSEDGVVTLRGVVASETLKERAVEIASAVPEVRQTVDHLRVSGAVRAEAAPGRTLGESLDDGGVELRVRAAFALDRHLRGAELDVSAYRRVVTLSGSVADADQAVRAVRIARETEGVTSVLDRLRVRGGGATTPVERVRRALAGNEHLSPYRLEVAEQAGRIELSGQVATGAERDLAGLLATAAAERPVDNRVAVRP